MGGMDVIALMVIGGTLYNITKVIFKYKNNNKQIEKMIEKKIEERFYIELKKYFNSENETKGEDLWK